MISKICFSSLFSNSIYPSSQENINDMAQQNGFLDEGAVGRPTPIPSSDPSEAARATPVAAAPSQPDNSRTDIPLNSMEPSIEMAELGIPRGFSSIDESNHQGFAPLKHSKKRREGYPKCFFDPASLT